MHSTTVQSRRRTLNILGEIFACQWLVMCIWMWRSETLFLHVDWQGPKSLCPSELYQSTTNRNAHSLVTVPSVQTSIGTFNLLLVQKLNKCSQILLDMPSLSRFLSVTLTLSPLSSIFSTYIATFCSHPFLRVSSQQHSSSSSPLSPPRILHTNSCYPQSASTSAHEVRS